MATSPRRTALTGGADLVVVDTETTGFARTDRVIEVALVRLSPTGAERARFSTLLQPGCPLGSFTGHGITPAMLRDAPRFAEVAGELAHHLDGAVFVAHNEAFDRRMLGAEFARLAVEVDWGQPICTMHAARRAFGVGSLRDACLAAGITQRGAHTAFGDVETTLDLLGALTGLGALTPGAPLRVDGVGLEPGGWVLTRGGAGA